MRYVHACRAAVAGSALVAVLAAGSACGGGDDAGDGSDGPPAEPAQAANLTPELAQLVEAARDEGELRLNWALNNAASLDPLVAAFLAAYDLDLDVTLTPTPNMPANLATLVEEHNAGRAAGTDAFIGTQDFLLAGGPDGADVFELVDWAELAPDVAELAVGDGVGVSLLDQIPGFAYHTGLFTEDELPTTMADVLTIDQPLASTPYAGIFNLLSADTLHGREDIEAHLRAFEPAGLIGCLDLDRIASGEFAALWIACGTNMVDIVAAQGAPLGHTVPTDAGIVQTWYMAVPVHAVNPHAAKLWIHWLTTPVAQQIVFAHEFADNRLVDGSRTAEQIAGYEQDGITFTFTDYEFVREHPEVAHSEFVQELGGLLRGED